MTQLGRAARRVVSRRRILPGADLSVAPAGAMVMLRLFDAAGVLEPAAAMRLAAELYVAAVDAGGGIPA